MDITRFSKIHTKLILLLILLGGGIADSHAERRLALVIGNGAYSNIGRLANPTADAELISRTLQDVGFETTLILDSNQFDMKSKIANFGRALRSADKETVGFFYYAGHGVQAQGRNYLLPVEAAPTDQADLDLMGVEANWVLRQMESAGNRTNIVVLDACRNNPFVSANRSMGRGLAQIDAPTGSFISYATAPGKVALDGDSSNSPFTKALAKALPTAGMAIEQIFKQVRVDVIKATNGAQTPWDSSSLVEDFFVLPKAEKVAAQATKIVQAQATTAPTPAELSLWQSVSTTGDPTRIALFLQVYPLSSIAPEARALLADLMTGNQSGYLKSSKEAPKQQAEAEPVEQNTPVVAEVVTEIVVESPKPVEVEASSDELIPSEDEMIASAQVTRSIGDFKKYIETYPAGMFVEFARAEIDHLESKSGAVKPVAETPKQIESVTNANASSSSNADTSSSTQAASSSAAVLTFEQPIAEDPESDSPRSLKQISKGSPLFAPIEGLPEEYWAKQDCSNCHHWTRDALCTQGGFYVGKEDAAIERIKHPLGGFFKKALKRWAKDGCQ